MLFDFRFTGRLGQMQDIVRRRIDLGRESPFRALLLRHASTTFGHRGTGALIQWLCLCAILILSRKTGWLGVGSMEGI